MVVNILAGIGVVALLIGAFYFVMYMEGIAEKRKQDRLEEFYRDEFNNDDDWWNEQDV